MFVPEIVFNKWRSQQKIEKDLEKKEVKTAKEQEILDVLQQIDRGETLNIISSPNGIFIMDEHNNPGNNYKLWDFHANFDLTPRIMRMIGEHAGVEVLKCFTRYRGWIGIGNLFDEKTIFKNINKLIKEHFYKTGQYILSSKDAARKCLADVLDGYDCHYDFHTTINGEFIPVAGKTKEELDKLLANIKHEESKTAQSE